MPLSRLSRMVTDPKLGAVEYKYDRITVTVDNKGRSKVEAVRHEAVGNIQPAPGKECERLPEGDLGKETIMVFTPAELTAGEDKNKADRILWRGKAYRVALAEPWAVAGFVKALAVYEGAGRE